MVDLNKTYKADKGQDLDFSPAPEGYYELRVKEIKPWKETIKDVAIIQRDEKGKALKDDKDKNITEMSKNHKIYNAQVVFEIVGGEHDGKRIWHNISTHPNTPYSIPSFLYGLGVRELAASKIQETCVGMMCEAKVAIETYDKKEVDKDTGIETITKVPKNVIKSFKEKPAAPNTEDEDDMGI